MKDTFLDNAIAPQDTRRSKPPRSAADLDRYGLPNHDGGFLTLAQCIRPIGPLPFGRTRFLELVKIGVLEPPVKLGSLNLWRISAVRDLLEKIERGEGANWRIRPARTRDEQAPAPAERVRLIDEKKRLRELVRAERRLKRQREHLERKLKREAG